MGLKSAYVSKLYGYSLYGLWNNAWRGLQASRHNVNLHKPGRLEDQSSRATPALWWEKPGLGLMFQIEARPGWSWQRNFDRFNSSLQAPDGALRFNGPFPQMHKWVAFSKRIGSDYHVFEAKWHDGICYWDTPLTRWKTPIDYCREFADASRAAGIPYGFYYSAVFDHNPDFDDIQPLRRATSSFLGMRGERAALKKSLGFTQFIRLLLGTMERDLKKVGITVEHPYPFFDDFKLNAFTSDATRYQDYVLAQLKELCGTYDAAIMWIDWFGADREALSDEIMDFMATRYPNVVLTFNASIIRNARWAHYLSFEAHGIRNTWQQVNVYRHLNRPWELVSPAAANWDVPQAKHNPVENLMTAALIMASGGKVNFGIAAEMDGSLRAQVVEQMEQLGDWYRPRRRLFFDAVPMSYPKGHVPGITVQGPRRATIGTIAGGDRLLHVFDLHADGTTARSDLVIEFSRPHWDGVREILVEPSGQTLGVERSTAGYVARIPVESVDPVDTILRVR